MAFWNRKNNKTNKDVEDIFGGDGIIAGTQPTAKTTRKDNVKKTQAVAARQSVKNAIAEALKQLRIEMYRDTNCTCVDELSDAITRLKNLPDNPDNEKVAQFVSRFMGMELKAARNNLNRKNYLALENNISKIAGYVNDMYDGGAYFTNKNYLKFKKSEEELEKEKQVKFAELDQAFARYKKLQAMANDPNRTVSIERIKEEAATLLQRKKDIEKIINNYNIRLKNIKAAITAFEQQAVTNTYAPTVEEFDGAIEAVQTNEAELGEQIALNDQLQGKGINYTSNSLAIDNDVFSSMDDNGAMTLPDWDVN